ncbi:acyltransferase [Saccharopolyspora sp. NPDC047091]|uniref:acyltransferase family protein n=1 Tax=Saccharopolyspora sp. NPDC047091 TaxID=3155924 RepID=UPI0033C12839
MTQTWGITERARTSRLPSLTSLRFISALLVFLFHASCTTPPWTFFGDPAQASAFSTVAADAGRIGVAFFFILSGFVLTWSSDSVGDVLDFWRRRLVKVFPNHLVTWALALVLFGGGTAAAGTVLANLFLLHPWVPDYDTFLSVNVPSWSLGCELLFYLAFPVLFPLIKRIPAARLWATAIGLIAAVFAVAFVAQFLVPTEPGLPEANSPGSVWQFWLVYFLPPVRALDFALGIVLARIVLSGRWIGLGFGTAALLTAGGYVLASFVPWVFHLNAVTIIPLALLIPAAACADIRGGRSPLRGRFAVWLGEISFAFYMVHALVLSGTRALLGPDAYFGFWAASGVVLAELVVSVLGAWLLYTTVERPIMRRFGRRRPPAAPGAPEGSVPAEPVPAK